MPDRDFWKKEEEILLKEWADKALCFYWMHLQAHRKYKTKNAWYTIPVIVISTITGTANFAQSNYGEYVQLATILIGTMNIIAGIITTIFQFLKISELNEGHKAAALSWCKFNEAIRVELLKNPIDRRKPAELLNYCSDQYTHLLEFSPILPQDTIDTFRKMTKKMKDITVPDLVGKLSSTRIFDETALTSLLVAPSVDLTLSNFSASSGSSENVITPLPNFDLKLPATVNETMI